jgi:hypothetical protein
MMRTWLSVALAVAVLAAIRAEARAVEADFSSPKGTMKTLLGYLKEGELDRAADCFAKPRNDNERNLLLFGMGDDVYLPALHHALVQKFGEEASPLANVLASYEQQTQVIDSMEETVDDLNGRLGIKGQEAGGITFTKVGGRWKVALVPGALKPVPHQRVPIAMEVRAAYLETIAGIQQDKFASAGEALAALDARRRAAVATLPAERR